MTIARKMTGRMAGLVCGLMLVVASAGVAAEPPATAKPAAPPTTAKPADTANTAAKAEAAKQLAELGKQLQEAEQLYKNGQFMEAVERFQKLPAALNIEGQVQYRIACAQAKLGQKAEALASLQKALDTGFVLFGVLDHEAAFDGLRTTDDYKKILAKKDDCLKASAAKRADFYRKQLGEPFSIEKDDAYRLIVCTDLKPDQRARILAILHSCADALGRDLFAHKPQIYIGLLIPANPAEFAQKTGMKNIAGLYNPRNHTLFINLATGPGTMSHEFTHALHFADMEQRGQQHPLWIIEGLGSLFEECQGKDGKLIGLVNWRLADLKSALSKKGTIPLAQLMSEGSKPFSTESSSGLAYAESRYIMLFLQERGLLTKWYNQYCQDFKTDPTGAKAIEKVYGQPLAEFETDWTTFVNGLKFKMPKAPTRTKKPTEKAPETAPVEPAAPGGN